MRKVFRLRWLGLDALIAAGAFLVAYAVLLSAFRFMPDTSELAGSIINYTHQALVFVAVVAFLRVFVFWLFGLYRGMSQFAGIYELKLIILATSIVTLTLVAWNFASNFILESPKIPGLNVIAWIPLSVIFVDWLCCIFMTGGVRIIRRFFRISRFNSGAAIHNMLIIGADHLAENVARNFLHNPQLGYRPVGFIDEDEDLIGNQIHGLRVLGTLESLPQHVQMYKVSDVVVALRSPSLQFLNRVVEVCEAAHVNFKIIPSPSDVMEDRVAIHQMRAVEIEDLLGRDQVDLRLAPEKNYLKNEVVLVTGAGGSIGSELCRQILDAEPKKLILLGRGENSVFEIAMELGYHYNHDKLELEIADVQDVDRMIQIFKRHNPSVVFHAAAHKHVPLMEMNPLEAVKNNIIGTYNVGMMSNKFKIKRFTMISTDKAVRPTSVMGVSKRVAEMIIASLSKDSTETDYLSVRFGNVLGSRGSVVPLFRKQIAAGGPVTVMHKDIERYFMTIPEAANLVIQTGAIGQNGQLFLLDMGEPVKIADLARRMITLSGYEPDVDIEIQYVGLRPGEKLTEELLTDGEDVTPTEHPKIMSTRIQAPDLEEVKSWLIGFQELIAEGNDRMAIERLRGIVPEYKPKSLFTANGEKDNH